ncbi:MAG: SLC13 family permease [Cryomorphaceae bacterium]
MPTTLERFATGTSSNAYYTLILAAMHWYKQVGLFSGPLAAMLVFILDPGVDALQTKVLSVAAWMLIWWVLEAVELYVTAMLPMVLFPMLGIMSVNDAFVPYANPIIFLFLGGFILALAMEERKLHERLAFSLLRLTGTRPAGIVLGFMLATWSVAMWISNTATAVMLLPIAISIIQLIKEQGTDDTLVRRISLLLMLGIAYAANIGGMVTLIGTPPNLVFAGFYYESFGTDFAFTDWLKVGIPVGVLLLGAGYVLLTKLVYPVNSEPIAGVNELLERKWKGLGKMARPERTVLIIFGFTVLLWVFSGQINDSLGTRVLNNTSIAMLGGILMFVTPVNLRKGEFVVNWSHAQKLPWGILILFGGGLSLASGLEHAGIISLIASFVADCGIDSVFLLMLGLTIVSLFLTEVMSNVALVTVLLPVVFGIATELEVNALLLTVPVTLAASCAFMMPISTPPNAVVYSSGYVSVKQMLRAGIWMNVVSVCAISLICYLLFA